MSVANNLTGKTLSNRYEILRPLGEGGMGKVYLAKDGRFGKQVVVKVPTMEAGDKDFKDRFMREIASIATLEHPHIVTTVDWGEIEGIPFLVLRYLGGGNLRDRITDSQGYYKPMPLENLNQWLPQIASALDFIHSKNWVHRDLKPDNILFDEAGNPYLADFGIAKALEGAPMGVKTTMGAFIGTPQYMAPEMHLGKEVGPRSDQFGLAVLVYEALAGKIPFAGATPTAIFMEVMQDKARLIHELVPGIPLEKSNALMKGITKESKDRYGSCVEFANAVMGSMLARGSSSAGSETPSRVAIPDTRMETPKKADIQGTRLEVPSKPEIAGTRLERTGDNSPVNDEAVLYEKPMGKKGNNSLTYNLGAGIRKRGVLSGIALLGILIITFIIVLGGKKSTPTVVSDRNKEDNRWFEKKEEATPPPKKQDEEKIKKEEEAKFAAIEKEMVLIPPGKFMMGSPLSEEFRSNDETQHEVNLTTPFYMGKYEVTQEQWQVVMGTNPSSRTKGAKLPVTDVSWDDCQEFIKKLNSKTDGGYRLPTEAEWEYACRAGTTTPYSYGDSLTKSDANIEGESIKEVGSYKPNAFGLYDLHGNVFEWCEDWFGDYPVGEVKDPKGRGTGKYRVLRGGSFDYYGSVARSSYRRSYSPSYRYYIVGFRLAKTADTKTAVGAPIVPKPDPTEVMPATGDLLVAPFSEAKAKEAQKETAKNLQKEVAGIEIIGKGIKLEMVIIPAGTFKRGSPTSEKGRSDDEKQHSVKLTKAYYIGKYEVTQNQWEVIMGNNPSKTKGENLPVTNVSWEDCQKFIVKLNTKTDGGYRFPTEAEWEYACRAGTTTAYSYGANLTNSDANIDGDSIKAVGGYKPNAFGLYDMHGNVWEWCEDWYAKYPDGAVMDPKGPATGERRVFRGYLTQESRVLRGGSFNSSASGAHSSCRFLNPPTIRDDAYGFRLARTP